MPDVAMSIRIKFFCAVTVILTGLVAHADALQVDRTAPYMCDAKLDTSNSALYNIAFDWTQHRKLDNWKYEDLGPDSSGRNCARVRYNTQIGVHKYFENFLPSRILETTVDKHVCAGPNVMDEHVVLSDIILIKTMTINVHVEIDRKTRTLRMVANTDLSVPWFLNMIEATILRELKESLTEYHQLLIDNACGTKVTKLRKYPK